MQALILAERVWRTDGGHCIIAGTFNKVEIERGSLVESSEDQDAKAVHRIRPGGAGAPYAYISLTDVADKTRLQLQFVSLKQNAVLFEQSLEIPCKDRFDTVELVVQLPPLQMAIAVDGEYAFQVLCAGELLGSHRILARTVVPERGDDDVE